MRAASPDTREMLFRWAEAIVVVDQQYASEIPEEWRAKVNVWHVGGDRFFRGFDIDLLNLYAEYIYRAGLAPKLVYTLGANGQILVTGLETVP